MNNFWTEADSSAPFNMYKDNYCATKFNNKTGIDKCKSESVYKFMAEYLK